jgi:predicted metalloendopeptidase
MSSPKSGIDIQYIDPQFRPQDDFYHYANGGWLSSHPIPSDAVRISAASVINDATQTQLKAILEAGVRQGSAASDSNQRKIALLYSSFMDERLAERRGIRPLRAWLAAIDSIRNAHGLAKRMGALGRIGVRVPIGDSVLNDSEDPDKYMLSLYQSGLGLPGRHYYLDDEPTIRAIRPAYLSHVAKMFELAGDTDPKADAQSVVWLETALARIEVSSADSNDPVLADNRFTVATLQEWAPGMDWRGFLEGSGLHGQDEAFIVAEPPYFKALATLARTVPLAKWKTYLRYQLLSAYGPYLSQRFVDEDFSFNGTTLRGIPQIPARWKRGLDLVNESMGEGLGQLYVARYISPEAKARVTKMVQTFVAAFSHEIDELAWMGPDTKRRAKEKLLLLHTKIGYPDHWRSYDSLRIVAGDLVGNVQRARQWEYQRNIDKLGKPVDRDEWYITPQTADAYEWLPQNEIVIGAALLQPPFFDPDADDAVNYGAIGGTIGHEMSHGFDNIGSQYDGRGLLLGKPGWFTLEDQQHFDALTHALVEQYSAFEPLPGYHVDGEQTLSENIADVAGAAIANRAYHLYLGGRSAPVIDGLTGDQRFFLGWAQRRRGNYRDKELIRILESDEHSPPAVRAVAPLMNLDAFYAAFDIKAGDPMYLPPEKRVRLW